MAEINNDVEDKRLVIFVLSCVGLDDLSLDAGKQPQYIINSSHSTVLFLKVRDVCIKMIRIIKNKSIFEE